MRNVSERVKLVVASVKQLSSQRLFSKRSVGKVVASVAWASCRLALNEEKPNEQRWTSRIGDNYKQTFNHDAASSTIRHESHIALPPWQGMPPITNQTITTGYDAGNRVRTLVDSINGTISRDYDNLDRGTKETTAHREWRLRSELQTAAPQHRLSQVGRD